MLNILYLVFIGLGIWTGLSVVVGLVIAPVFARRLRDVNFPRQDD